MTIDPQLEQMSRELCDAAQAGDVLAVRRLLDAGASSDPVWNAVGAARDHERLIRKLRAEMPDLLAQMNLELPDDLLAEMPLGGMEQPPRAPHAFEIPLFCAARSGSVDCVRALLEAGADVRMRDASGQCAVFSAGSTEVVTCLVEAGVDARATDDDGDDAFASLLDDLTDDEDSRGKGEVILKALLQVGVPLVEPNARWGHSRLYQAAFRENLYAVRFLLEAGHPIDVDNSRTALHAICWHWDYGDERDEVTRGIVRALLDAGFSPHARDSTGDTPLHEALSGDGSNLVAAEELLAAGADIDAVNADGVTPLLLHYETLFDYERVVPFMIERGANPLIADRRGQTVIDAARRMIEGGQPMWRTEMAEAEATSICGWKGAAEPGDAEYRLLRLLEEAAARHPGNARR